MLLTLKGPLYFGGQMRFREGTYGLKFCPNFLKHFLKIEKLISFMGIYIFFSFGDREQQLCPNKLKREEREQQKKFAKI